VFGWWYGVVEWVNTSRTEAEHVVRLIFRQYPPECWWYSLNVREAVVKAAFRSQRGTLLPVPLGFSGTRGYFGGIRKLESTEVVAWGRCFPEDPILFNVV